MFVVVLRKAAFSRIVFIALLLLVLAGAFFLWSWLREPYPLPVIGLDGLSDRLVCELFSPGQIGRIRLATGPELQDQLALGTLDYIIEIDKPTPGLNSWFIGELEPVIIVPFFDPASEIDDKNLETLLEEDPGSVVVSTTLALPHFPWSDLPVNYVSSADVVHQVSNGEAIIGVIPLQDRVPAVRVLPLLGTLSLTRSLYLSRGDKSLAQRLKDHYTGHQDLRSIYQRARGVPVTLIAVGDIMLDRDVKKVGIQTGWEEIFAGVAPRLTRADLAFANLESPIGDKGHFINMFQAPPDAIQGLVYAGFDIVSLANNHTLDYHHAGMFETMRLLDEHEIAWVGAGENIHQARKPLIKEVNGVRIGFLAYTELWFVHAREPISWQGTKDEPGVAPAELDMITEDIGRLRDRVDCVIVSIHWGQEYKAKPTEEQKRLARAAVDAGADIILGHHPHVLQGIEFYKRGVIAYSLGNFVFDINIAKTWETMMLEFTVSPSGPLDMNIVPAYIFGVQPKIIEGTHKDALYRQIRDLSLSID